MSALPVLYELRVLRGGQRGASAPVTPGAPLEVSGEVGSDVVLRADELAGCRVRLQLQDERVHLQVLSGHADVGGRALAEGGTAELPLYTPLALGDGVVVALGAVGAARWAGLFGEDADAEPPAAPAAVPAPATPRWVRRLVATGAALVVASMGMYAIASVVGPAPMPLVDQAHRAQALLHAQGLTGLSVKAEGDALVVSGYLETTAQRSAAERALAAEQLPARLDVWINEQVAAAVQEVYRVNGIAAEVEPVGPGALRVRTQVASTEALQATEAKARRDVPGLNSLQAHNRAPARTPSPVPAVEDPGKRVAAVVPGDTPHVVTADGSRYFQGALLPTGHRIRSIQGDAVELEREGSVSTLRF